MSALYTFAANNDLFRKRKRVYRACESCKKRRKRCNHTFDDGIKQEPSVHHQPANNRVKRPKLEADRSPPGLDTRGEISDEGSGEDSIDESSKNRSAHRHLKSPGGSRFVGDLSAEAALVSADHPLERGGGAGSNQSRVGFWSSTKPSGRAASHQTSTLPQDHVASFRTTATPERLSLMNHALSVYVDAFEANLLPSIQQQDVLVNIYFSRVNKLLPLVDEPGYRASRHLGQASTMLTQAICIVACRHDEARSYLYFEYPHRVLEPKAFAERLYNAVIASLNARLERDRLVMIRTLALISFTRENSSDHDQASLHLATAIHHAQSMGMQIAPIHTEKKDESLEKLWWSLWSLDKLNACINGRPMVIREHDVGLADMVEDKAHRHTAFGIWLQLASLLDKMVPFYRPTSSPTSTGWEEDFPSFEDIVGPGAASLEPEVSVFLELLYHSVAMLSCRLRCTSGPVKSTPSYVRASLSSVRVLSILRSPSHKNLPPLPSLPWSVCLAISLNYRQYRQSKLATHKDRAKDDLRSCCAILESFSPAYPVAEVFLNLGRAALARAEKVSKASATVRSIEGISVTNGDTKPGQPIQTSPSTVASTSTTVSSAQHFPDLFSMNAVSAPPGQHPISSTRNELQPFTSSGNGDLVWLTAEEGFDNIDSLLGNYPGMGQNSDAWMVYDDMNGAGHYHSTMPRT